MAQIPAQDNRGACGSEAGGRARSHERRHFSGAHDSLDFLIREGGASSLPDAAYRFCRHEPGVDVVLSGTGSLEHLESNVASLSAPPLPEEDLARLRRIFASVDQVSGE